MLWVDYAVGVGALGSTLTGAIALWLAVRAMRVGREAVELQSAANRQALKVEYGPRLQVVVAQAISAPSGDVRVAFYITDTAARFTGCRLIDATLVGGDGQPVASLVPPWVTAKLPEWSDDDLAVIGRTPRFVPSALKGEALLIAFSLGNDPGRLVTSADWTSTMGASGKKFVEGIVLKAHYADAFGERSEDLYLPSLTIHDRPADAES